MRKKIARLVLLLVGLFLLAGCNVGINGTSSITFSISPSSATVSTGSTTQFSVYANGTLITNGIAWAVNGAAGGSSTTGTISGTGLYTAPATVPDPDTVSVTATQQGTGDGALTATVKIVGTVPTTITVSISPQTATLASNAGIQLTATVTNDASNEGVNWTTSLSPSTLNAPPGSLTATWTAPCVTQSTTVQITATSVADPTQSASAAVTVMPPTSGSCGGGGGGGGGGSGGNCTSPPVSADPPQINVLPNNFSMEAGSTQTFQAIMFGDNSTNQNFTFSLNSLDMADAGTLDQTSGDTVTYTTGNPSQLIAVQLIATSVAYTCVQGYATFNVSPAQ